MLSKLLIILTSLILSNQNSIVLKIEICGLKNSEGQVLLEFYDIEMELVTSFSRKIENNCCTFTISDLNVGNYRFKYFHDENGNKKIDTNFIGIPKEGFGFSNNAKGNFGPPSKRKMIFELAADTVHQCNPIYINN